MKDFFGFKPIFGRMQYIAIAKKSFAKIHVHKFLNKIFILKMCPQVVLDIMSMAINYYFLKIPLHINSKLLQNYPHLNKKTLLAHSSNRVRSCVVIICSLDCNYCQFKQFHSRGNGQNIIWCVYHNFKITDSLYRFESEVSCCLFCVSLSLYF